MPPVSTWIRNSLIGAALASFKALFALLISPGDHFAQLTAGALAAAGAAAGLGFTALTPLRKRNRFGHYAVWVTTIYVLLAAITVPWALAGDEFAVSALTRPWGWVFLFGTGLVTGIFCARAAERWSKGDYR